MPGPGGVFTGSARSYQSCRLNSGQSAERARDSSQPGGWKLDEEVCREENSSRRTPTPFPGCLHDCRELEHRFRKPEHRTARGAQSDDVFCGTGCNRAGPYSDCMASVRMAGTSVPNPSIAQETQRPATVLPDLQPQLDFRQFSLCQRFGLYGKPAIRKCKGIKSHSASRGRAVSSAQTAAPESQNRPFPRREVPRN